MQATDHFDEAIVESIDEALRALFSQQVVDAFHETLKTRRSLNEESVPANLAVVSVVLEKYFGQGAHTIENTIAQRLYSKWGLQFQNKHDGRLTEYVAQARIKVQPTVATHEAKNVILPLKDDFDGLLVESIKEGIEDIVGKDSAKMAFKFLEREVPFDKLTHHLPTFYSALRRNFGKDSPTVELTIAKKLYQKLYLEFNETPNVELSKYTETAYTRIIQREQEGLFNVSARITRG
jgi:hypothetical protein